MSDDLKSFEARYGRGERDPIALANSKLADEKRGREENSRRNVDLPELYSIHKGKVRKIEKFGIFLL